MGYAFDHQMGQTIRKIRECKGFTQEQLAAKLQTLGCDITRSSLAKIEVGQRHIYSGEICAIKKALDITYDKLFDKA